MRNVFGRRFWALGFLSVVLGGVLFARPARAEALPSFDLLLPPETKAYLSVTSVSDMRQKWRATQIGQLASDPIMQPFAESLRAEIREKVIDSRFHVSIDFQQLAETCSGEMCVATIHPPGEESGHASVILLDVTGNQEAAKKLLLDTATQLDAKGGKRSVRQVGGHELVIYELPRQRGEIEIHKVVRLLSGDLLLLGNHEATCLEIVKRLEVRGDSLVDLPAFETVMKRVAGDGVVAPEIQWFVQPFGYAQVIRNARGGVKRRGKDMLTILRNQGFDAVEALGGWIHMGNGNEDLSHRTFVFAPGVADAATQAPQDRFRLAARMLDFPNTDNLSWPDWVPRELSSAVTLR